jgi:DNA/RNA endonuclease YhcR with UshA esterase domain
MKASVIFLAVFCAHTLPAAGIPAAQAKDHVGQTATVCGKVAGTRYLQSSDRQPTFLNFDKPYPDHTFTAIIFGDNRAKFGKPEQDYWQKNLCVTGEIKNYNGKPQIEVSDPKQIRLESR